MSQFYADGVPADAVPRVGRFPEVRNNATVVKGMRRTGKTYFTYLRMLELLSAGIPLERIVHVNFDDERLAAMNATIFWTNFRTLSGGSVSRGVSLTRIESSSV